MLLPDKKYRNRLIVAIADAITAASTDLDTMTVTYGRADAAQACALMAGLFLNSRIENAAPITAEQAHAWFAEVLKQVPASNTLDAGRPGFATRTLA